MWKEILSIFNGKNEINVNKETSEEIAENAIQLGQDIIYENEKGQLSEQRKYEQAILLFTIAIEHRGNSNDYRMRGVARIDYADILERDEAKHLEAATSDLEKALELASEKESSDYAWLGLAKTKLADELSDREAKLKHLDEAYQHLRLAIRIAEDPDDQFWAGINRRYAADEAYTPDERNTLLQTALKHLKRSYKIDPDEDTLEEIEEVTEDLGLFA